MKSKGTSNHSKQNEATRKTAELEQTICQLERAVAELDQFIERRELFAESVAGDGTEVEFRHGKVSSRFALKNRHPPRGDEYTLWVNRYKT